jgi:hypothetical protein
MPKRPEREKKKKGIYSAKDLARLPLGRIFRENSKERASEIHRAGAGFLSAME